MPGAVMILLIVGLWLCVLAPLLLRNQGPVRRTSPALQETRVLFEGGSGSLKSRVRHPIPTQDEPAEAEDQEYRLLDEGDAPLVQSRAAHAAESADDQDEPELVEAELLADASDRADDLQDTADRADDQLTQSATSSGVGPVVDAASRVSPAIMEGEIVLPAPGAEDNDEASHDEDTQSAADESETTESDDVSPDNVITLHSAADERDDEEFELSLSSEQRRRYHDREENPDAYLRPADVMSHPQQDPGFAEDSVEPQAQEERTADESENHRRISLTNLIEETFEPEVEFTEADRDFASARRGRGYYDPERAQRLAKERCQKRQRVFLGCLVVLAALVVCSIMWGGLWWFGAGAALLFTGLYLVNLRRQALEEQRLAQRRLQRMRRARLGVSNAADDELNVPHRLRRPMGVVIETIDDDPELSDLPFAPVGLRAELDAGGQDDGHQAPHRSA